MSRAAALCGVIVLSILCATALALSDFCIFGKGTLSAFLSFNLAMRHKVPFAIDDLSDFIFLCYLLKTAGFFSQKGRILAILEGEACSL